MTSSLTDIRTAIKATIAQAGLNVYDTEMDVVNTPAVVVLPSSSSFTNAMRGASDEYRFDLAVLVARTDTRAAQQKLDQYITGHGPKSIRETILLNCNLGLDDVDALCEGMRAYGGKFDTATTNFVGAVLRLCVTVIG